MGELLVPLNQRRAMRRAARFECQVVRERDFKLLGDCGLDLSAEGMLVLTDERVLTGEDVLVSFRAPGVGSWFDTAATIARIVHGRRPGDAGRALGLHFDRLDSVTRTYIRAGLRGIPPIVPGREPRVNYAETARRIQFDD